MCMRTNIVLNDELIREAMQHSNAKTKRALVEEALETFIRVKQERLRRETYRDRLKDLDLRLSKIRLKDRPLDLLRKDRDR